MRANHFKKARAVVEQRYRANPNDPETCWLLSEIRHEWRDLDAAETLAEKAVAANPRDARYHLQLSGVLGDRAEKASLLHQIGLARRFRKELDAALALDPKNAEALNYLMLYYYEAPGIVGGDKRKAHEVPAQIQAVDSVKGYFAQIWLARADKQEDRLEDLYRKAVEAQPASYEAHLALAYYYNSRKKTAEAESEARRALALDPSLVGAYNLLAGMSALLGKWKDLDDILDRSEKNVPDDWSPSYWAANACLGKSVELPRAERYLRHYLTQEPEPTSPNHAQAHLQLGRVLDKQGRRPEAIAEWQASVKLNPNSPAREELKKAQR